MQKMQFVEAEKTIAEKKYVHQEVMRRGLDFLTQVELGKAPPLEYAVKNIQATRDTSLIVGEDMGSLLCKLYFIITYSPSASEREGDRKDSAGDL